MQIEMMLLEEIKPSEHNPKVHNPEQIELVKKSIETFGWAQPIAVDVNNEIIIGHARYAAAKLIGEAEVPVVHMDHLTDKQIKALRLADNKLNQITGFDFELVMSDLEDIGELADLTGFNLEELKNPFEPEKEVKGLPDFDQEALNAYQTIVVRFDTPEDVSDFAKIINQTITPNTKYLWHPKKDQDQMGRDLAYVSE